MIDDHQQQRLYDEKRVWHSVGGGGGGARGRGRRMGTPTRGRRTCIGTIILLHVSHAASVSRVHNIVHVLIME